MPQKDGRPDWWWVGRNFPRISRNSRTNPWELTGPSFCAVIAAKDGLLSGPFPVPISRMAKCDINEAFLFAIMTQIEGRPDCWRVGRNSPSISRKSRTGRWGLAGPSFWDLIAAKGGLFQGSFFSPISRWLKWDKDGEFAIMVRKEGRLDRWRVGRNFPRISRKSRTSP